MDVKNFKGLELIINRREALGAGLMGLLPVWCNNLIKAPMPKNGEILVLPEPARMTGVSGLIGDKLSMTVSFARGDKIVCEGFVRSVAVESRPFIDVTCMDMPGRAFVPSEMNDPGAVTVEFQCSGTPTLFA